MGLGVVMWLNVIWHLGFVGGGDVIVWHRCHIHLWMVMQPKNGFKRFGLRSMINWFGLMVCRCWFMVCRSWFMVCRSWFMISRSWFMVGRNWFMVGRNWFMVGRCWFMVGWGRLVVGRSWFVVSSVHSKDFFERSTMLRLCIT